MDARRPGALQGPAPVRVRLQAARPPGRATGGAATSAPSSSTPRPPSARGLRRSSQPRSTATRPRAEEAPASSASGTTSSARPSRASIGRRRAASRTTASSAATSRASSQRGPRSTETRCDARALKSPAGPQDRTAGAERLSSREKREKREHDAWADRVGSAMALAQCAACGLQSFYGSDGTPMRPAPLRPRLLLRRDLRRLRKRARPRPPCANARPPTVARELADVGAVARRPSRTLLRRRIKPAVEDVMRAVARARRRGRPRRRGRQARPAADGRQGQFAPRRRGAPPPGHGGRRGAPRRGRRAGRGEQAHPRPARARRRRADRGRRASLCTGALGATPPHRRSGPQARPRPEDRPLANECRRPATPPSPPSKRTGRSIGRDGVRVNAEKAALTQALSAAIGDRRPSKTGEAAAGPEHARWCGRHGLRRRRNLALLKIEASLKSDPVSFFLPGASRRASAGATAPMRVAVGHAVPVDGAAAAEAATATWYSSRTRRRCGHVASAQRRSRPCGRAGAAVADPATAE